MRLCIYMPVVQRLRRGKRRRGGRNTYHCSNKGVKKRVRLEGGIMVESPECPGICSQFWLHPSHGAKLFCTHCLPSEKGAHHCSATERAVRRGPRR